MVQHAFSQDKFDYVRTDTSILIGVKLKGGTPKDNTYYIKAKSKDSIINYTPDDIIEYGFKDGRVYVSRKIPLPEVSESVFVERLVKGKISLYSFKASGLNSFFIESDSGHLVRLTKELEAFKEMSVDCEYIEDAIKLSSFNKQSLSALVKYYNNCEGKAYPYTKIGTVLGAGAANLIFPSNFGNALVSNTPFKLDTYSFAGINADLPLYLGGFSLNVGINYVKNGFSGNESTRLTDTDILIDLTAIEAPILIRYSHSSTNWRPFANIGVNYNYLLTNTSSIYRSSVEPNNITINEVIVDPFLPKNMLGFSMGLGLQKHIDFRRTVIAELRYNQLFGLENPLGKQNLNFSLGFTY